MKRAIASLALLAVLFPTIAAGQTRDEKVRDDRAQLKDDSAWFYDDLDNGIQAAQKSGKPMMVVLRCIP